MKKKIAVFMASDVLEEKQSGKETICKKCQSKFNSSSGQSYCNKCRRMVGL